MATMPNPQEGPNAVQTRHENHCPPTKPPLAKKRPRTLADVPQAVLHKEIFQFDALRSENAHLRSEVARLRKILTQPYYEASLELIKSKAAAGLTGSQLRDEELVEVYTKSEEPLTLADQWPHLTHEDKVSIVPQLVARGFCVQTFGNDNLGSSMSVSFKYEWDDKDRRTQERALASGFWGPAYAPPTPRFAVGAAVLCKQVLRTMRGSQEKLLKSGGRRA